MQFVRLNCRILPAAIFALPSIRGNNGNGVIEAIARWTRIYPAPSKDRSQAAE
jgi:hypothetical protein